MDKQENFQIGLHAFFFKSFHSCTSTSLEALSEWTKLLAWGFSREIELKFLLSLLVCNPVDSTENCNLVPG